MVSGRLGEYGAVDRIVYVNKIDYIVVQNAQVIKSRIVKPQVAHSTFIKDRCNVADERCVS
jgi:hypothetical protein